MPIDEASSAQAAKPASTNSRSGAVEQLAQLLESLGLILHGYDFK